ncbi:MAG: DUF262 domain-containing protein [Campylobacterales bacterium]|nr:DUF262 domain-containing protein [Campylobacterales bacterium]
MSRFFEPKDLSISGLFKNDDPIYKIPNYQRPYSWEDEQVDALWDDIYESYDSNKSSGDESNYFIGSIIVVKTDKPKIYDVVDGQQRLTTLMILFRAIQALYPKVNEDINSDEMPDVVKSKLINSCIFNDNESKRLTFYTDEKHGNAFTEKIINNNNFTDIQKPYKIHGVEDRFENTAYIFIQKLKKIEDEIGEFVNYLFNKVMIIKIVCKDPNFAIKLFQVLNNRGLDLSQADLIKAYLISTIKVDEHKNTFIASWRSIETKLDSTDISFNDLFTYQLHYLKASNPKKSLNQELEEAFKSKDANTIIIETDKLSKLYADLYSSRNKELYGFWYLPWDIWKSIYLTIKLVNHREADPLLREIQRFFYLFWIAGNTFSAVKQTSYNLIGSIKDGKSMQEIQNTLETKLQEEEIVKKAKEKLVSNDFYSKKWAKPILCLLEYSYLEEADFIECDKKLQLEHILPQKFFQRDGWLHINKDDGEKHLNSLGNLTLLSGAKNPEAQNYPFPQKLSIYEGKGRNGTKNKGWTQYRMTQNIVKMFKDQSEPMWDTRKIVERGDSLLTELFALFKIETY